MVEFEILGFWRLLLKLFGPVQEYVGVLAPFPDVVAVKLIVFPLQTKRSLPAFTERLITFTITVSLFFIMGTSLLSLSFTLINL